MYVLPFFIKRKQPQKKEADTQKECNIQEVMEEIDKVLEELAEAEGQQRIDFLNKLGSLYFKANNIDKSIEYYEASISEVIC
jgi:hypothetical protein